MKQYVEQIERYVWPSDNFIIYMNYCFIDNILINGIPIIWKTLNATLCTHPESNTKASDDKIIEIQYRNDYDNYRLIVKNNIKIIDICEEIVWTVYDKRPIEFIIYAKDYMG